MAKVMILGNGGREHALAWWFKQYNHEVLAAPGNGGTASIGKNIDIDIDDFDAVAHEAVKNYASLVVVGPERQIVDGLADYWREREFLDKGVRLFCPSKSCAELEGSKIFARKFAKRHNIPVPDFAPFENENVESNIRAAKSYLERSTADGRKPLLVVKADGICGGKGVIVNDNIKETLAAIDSVENFGNAGKKLLLEERLSGEEASIIAVTDGNSYRLFSHSQDHKRRYEKDTGPNTGGMGAYAPTRLVDAVLEKRITDEIIVPTIEGMKKESLDYKGVLYFAVMMQDGRPYLIEYNCRFGDPETQAIVPLVDADPYKLFNDCLSGRLSESDFKLKDAYSCCVVLVEGSYPSGKSKGEEISFGRKLKSMKDVVLFHAGTKLIGSRLVTDGGRIMGVTSVSDKSHKDAIDRAYEAEKHVYFKNKSFRNDIGYRVL